MAPPLSRRALLRSGGLALGALAGCAGPTDESTPTNTSPASDGDGGGSAATPTDTSPSGPSSTPSLDDLSLGATEVASGFTSPVDVVARDGGGYVVDQPGRIYRYDESGVVDEPFLDLRDRVVEISGYSERGLLGLAVHPNFEENGRLFVRYSAPSRSGTPDSYSHTFVLSEFRADGEAGTADPASEEPLLEIPEPQSNHNAGDLAFGPDGYLYVPVGDGGGANDQGEGHVDDWYDAVPGGNGQDVTENLLGSILRIDVDAGGAGAYGIPDDNPLVGAEGLDEQYAWGFRNPWRISFDPDGRLFAADVGQSQWEEVDVVERGGNYGWNVREGAHCFQADECPTETPDGEPLIDPVIEYPHGGADVSGIAVVGGYVYDGTAIPPLQGHYVFADWRAGGRVFVATETDDGLWPVTAVPVEGGIGSNVLAFGQEPNGELLVCMSDRQSISGSSGAVYRLTSA